MDKIKCIYFFRRIKRLHFVSLLTNDVNSSMIFSGFISVKPLSARAILRTDKQIVDEEKVHRFFGGCLPVASSQPKVVLKTKR